MGRHYIRHPEELSLLRKPRDPTKKKKKKLDDQYEDETLELEGPLITPGSVVFCQAHAIAADDWNLGSVHHKQLHREQIQGPLTIRRLCDSCPYATFLILIVGQ
uniref:Uncharacterized protein n=1 Tax=Sphaerodactylus townsendi TaxID=933632 RepID=A0ACB8G6K9_9SAUR